MDRYLKSITGTLVSSKHKPTAGTTQLQPRLVVRLVDCQSFDGTPCFVVPIATDAAFALATQQEPSRSIAHVDLESVGVALRLAVFLATDAPTSHGAQQEPALVALSANL